MDKMEKAAQQKKFLATGIEFEFNDGEQHIKTCGNKYGKEIIHINGQLISQKRSFGRRSIHQFTIAQDEYEVEFYAANLLVGEVHCTLIKNGVHFETQRWRPYNKIPLLKSFLLGFVASFITVYIMKTVF